MNFFKTVSKKKKDTSKDRIIDLSVVKDKQSQTLKLKFFF